MSKILIIEDEEAIADLEKDYLELSDFEVEIEHTGNRGLQKALEKDFDLVILDLMLPEMDGFDVCRKIREEKNIPILMVSAKKDDIDKIRGLLQAEFGRHLELLDFRRTDARQIKLLELLRRAALLWKQRDTEFRIRNIFSEIWLLLLEDLREREIPSGSSNAVSRDRIQTMIAFIQQNYQEKLSLEDIARSASVSRSECLRCFRTCIHRTPFEYLLDYRIESAERLLRTTDASVLDIALSTGFSNGAYFGKMFKEARGIPPGLYRKIHQRSPKTNF